MERETKNLIIILLRMWKRIWETKLNLVIKSETMQERNFIRILTMTNVEQVSVSLTRNSMKTEKQEIMIRE